MVYYSYAPVTAKVELAPHLADYQSTASQKNAKSRLAALWLLQTLGARTGLPVDLPIQTTNHGRPFFAAEDAPDFNLSHSDKLAACALGDCRVGLDVQAELARIEVEGLAARFFSEREQARLAHAPREFFFELWTQKEALGKWLGEGLVPLLKKDTDALAAQHGVRLFTERFFVDGQAYTLSVCSPQPPKFIQI